MEPDYNMKEKNPYLWEEIERQKREIENQQMIFKAGTYIDQYKESAINEIEETYNEIKNRLNQDIHEIERTVREIEAKLYSDIDKSITKTLRGALKKL